MIHSKRTSRYVPRWHPEVISYPMHAGGIIVKYLIENMSLVSIEFLFQSTSVLSRMSFSDWQR